jgi:hypothetical protein
MHYRFLLVLSFLAQFVFAQQIPSGQPQNLSFSGIKAYGLSLTFETVSDANGYLVLRSDRSITDVPVQQVSYKPGDRIGNAKVVYAGSGNELTLRGLRANTWHHFAVFAYNAQNQSIAYNLNTALIDSIITPGSNPGSYYAQFNPQSPTFVSDLSNLIYPHNRMDYGQFDENVVFNVLQQDTTGGQHVVYCEYSGQPYIFDGIFVPPGSTWTSTGFSREHIFPRSWMRTNPSAGRPEHDDYHNLALANNNQVNVPRSNYPMGYVVSDSTNLFFEAVRGRDSKGNIVYEVKDSFKGDVARAIFYMVVAYNGKGGSWAFDNLPSRGPTQDIEVLKEWHFNDLPDNFEIAKHEYIYDLQNNRNPFIDFPELVDCIDFRLLLPKAECVSGSATNVKNSFLDEKIRVFPNPAESMILIDADDVKITAVEVFSLTGALIHKQQNNNVETVKIDAKKWQKGMYLIRVYAGEKSVMKQVLLT